MRKPYFIPLILAVSFLISGYTGKPIYCITDPTRPHVAGAETAVDAYLKAVDRGELKIFDKKSTVPGSILPVLNTFMRLPAERRKSGPIQTLKTIWPSQTSRAPRSAA